MFIVGIDVAKRSHVVRVIDDQGQTVYKPFSIRNNCSGCNALLERLRKLTNHKSEFIFAMESTAHYWLALHTRLRKEGYQVVVLNPIQTDAMREMLMQEAKTDEIDTLVIAETIRFGRDKASSVPQEKLLAMRELCRNRFYLIDMASDLKRKITAFVVVLAGRQPACVLRLAAHYFISTPFCRFSGASTIVIHYLLNGEDLVSQFAVALLPGAGDDGGVFRPDESALLQHRHILAHNVPAHADGVADPLIALHAGVVLSVFPAHEERVYHNLAGGQPQQEQLVGQREIVFDLQLHPAAFPLRNGPVFIEHPVIVGQPDPLRRLPSLEKKSSVSGGELRMMENLTGRFANKRAAGDIHHPPPL